jgi:hypothetical protein
LPWPLTLADPQRVAAVWVADELIYCHLNARALGARLWNNLTLFLTLATRGLAFPCPKLRRLTPARRQAPPLPAVDPENAQLVIFVRSKVLKRWMPLNVLNGGSQANGLVKGMELELTKEASTSTLKREVARMIYKERAQMEDTVRKSFPPMKFVKEFEYGMCVLDREKVRESVMGNLGVMLLPAEDEMGQTPVESVAAGAAGVVGNLTSGFKSFMDGLAGQGAATAK